MSQRDPFTTVSFDHRDPVEVKADQLRNELLQIRKLKLGRREDQEDAAHNVIVRVLEAADSNQLATADALDTELVRQKTEAERSSVRRRLKRESRREPYTGGVSDSVSSDIGLCQVSMDELYTEVLQSLELTEAEREFFISWYMKGEDDYAAMAESKGVDTKKLYRLHHRLKKKLKKIPELLLEGINLDDLNERRHAQVESMPRGQRQTSSRVF